MDPHLTPYEKKSELLASDFREIGKASTTSGSKIWIAITNCFDESAINNEYETIGKKVITDINETKINSVAKKSLIDPAKLKGMLEAETKTHLYNDKEINDNVKKIEQEVLDLSIHLPNAIELFKSVPFTDMPDVKDKALMEKLKTSYQTLKPATANDKTLLDLAIKLTFPNKSTTIEDFAAKAEEIKKLTETLRTMSKEDLLQITNTDTSSQLDTLLIKIKNSANTLSALSSKSETLAVKYQNEISESRFQSTTIIEKKALDNFNKLGNEKVASLIDTIIATRPTTTTKTIIEQAPVVIETLESLEADQDTSKFLKHIDQSHIINAMLDGVSRDKVEETIEQMYNQHIMLASQLGYSPNVVAKAMNSLLASGECKLSTSYPEQPLAKSCFKEYLAEMAGSENRKSIEQFAELFNFNDSIANDKKAILLSLYTKYESYLSLPDASEEDIEAVIKGAFVDARTSDDIRTIDIKKLNKMKDNALQEASENVTAFCNQKFTQEAIQPPITPQKSITDIPQSIPETAEKLTAQPETVSTPTPIRTQTIAKPEQEALPNLASDLVGFLSKKAKEIPVDKGSWYSSGNIKDIENLQNILNKIESDPNLQKDLNELILFGAAAETSTTIKRVVDILKSLVHYQLNNGTVDQTLQDLIVELNSTTTKLALAAPLKALTGTVQGKLDKMNGKETLKKFMIDNLGDIISAVQFAASLAAK